MKLLSRVRLFATPWTAAYQAPPSMGFSRQKYWSGVSLPSLNIPISKLLIREGNASKLRELHLSERPLTHNMHFEIALAQGESSCEMPKVCLPLYVFPSWKQDCASSLGQSAQTP